MSSGVGRDSAVTADGPGRARLAASAALACVPLLMLAASPQWLRGETIAEQCDLTDVYQPSVFKIRAGGVPYRDFPLEYPLLSLPVVLTPALAGANSPNYERAFVLQMLLINAVLIQVVAAEVERTAGRARVAGALVWYCLFFTALARMIVSRIDLAPTLLAFGSASLWSRGKTAGAGALAGLGALMKVFPGLVALPAALREASRAGGRRYRGISAFAAVMAFGVAAWLAVGGRGVIASLAYHGERGLEIESVYAGLLAGFGRLAGWRYAVGFDHGSYNLRGPWAGEFAKLSGLIQLVMLSVTLGQFARTGFRSGMRFTLAVLVGTIATAKVLSPQYFIWLLPFAVALDDPVGRYARPLYAAVCVLTLAGYPALFEPLTRLQPAAVLLLNLRNALTLALWGLLMFGGGRGDVAPGVASTS